MKEMSISEALSLVRVGRTPAISLYLRTNVDEREGVAALRNNLTRLYEKAASLVESSYEPGLRERLLRPLANRLASLRLKRRRGGLAIYHTENFTGLVQLPNAVDNLAVASESFHLKPLWRSQQLSRSFYVLALRRKQHELLLVSDTGVTRVAAYSMPTAEQVGGEVVLRRWINGAATKRRPTMFKGDMRAVVRSLESYWLADRRPLLLAGPHHLIESVRGQTSYGNIVKQTIARNLDGFSAKALVRLARPIMERYFEAIDEQAVVQFRKAEVSGLAATKIQAIAAAAAAGQVHTLLVAADRHVWGHLDRETGSVVFASSHEQVATDDLLDDIAELVILKGGRVTVLPILQMPDYHAIAATLRWSDPQIDRSCISVEPIARGMGMATAC